MLNVRSCASAMELLPLIELLVLKGPGPPIRGQGWFLEVPSKSVEKQWHPTPVLLPGKSHGRRSPVGCSP